MKQFTQVNNSKGLISRFLGLKSRITSTKPVLTMLALLMVALFGVNEKAWGNTATNSGSGAMSGGNIVVGGNHATFTFAPSSGSFTDKSIVGIGDVGYYWIKVSKNSTTNVNLTWSCNGGQSIKVTAISFKVKLASGGKAVFNGTTKTYSSSWGANNNYTLSASNNNGLTSGMTLALTNTKTGWLDGDVEFQIDDISFTYTITPNAPTVSPSSKSVNVTINSNSPTTTSYKCFSTSDHFGDYMQYAFSTNGNPGNAGHLSGDNFYATDSGTYKIHAYIAALANCHEQSDNSNDLTITVNPRLQSFNVKNDSVEISKTGDVVSLDLRTLISEYSGYNNATPSFSKVTKSGYANVSNATITDGYKFSATALGTYRVKVTYAGTKQYRALSKEFDVKVVKRTPTFTWTLTGENDHIYSGDTLVNLALTSYGTANLNLPLTYSADPANLVHIPTTLDSVIVKECTENKTCTITASFAGNGTYCAASSTHTYTFEPKITPVMKMSGKELSAESNVLHLLINDTVHFEFEGIDETKFSVPQNPQYVTYVHDAVNHKGVLTGVKFGNEGIQFSQAGTDRIFSQTRNVQVYVDKHPVTLTTTLNGGTWKVDSIYDGVVYSVNTPGAGEPAMNPVSVTAKHNNVLQLVDGHWKAIGAGKDTLVIAQQANDYWAGDTIEAVITVEKYDPVFDWSGVRDTLNFNTMYINPVASSFTGNPVTYESNKAAVVVVNDTILRTAETADNAVTITAKQVGNYKYNDRSETKTVKVLKLRNHVEVNVTSSESFSAVFGGNQGEVAWDGNNGIRLGGSKTGPFDAPAWNWGDKYVDIKFEGIPKTVSFTTGVTAGAATAKVVNPGSGNNNGFWYMVEHTKNGSWSSTNLWTENNNSTPGTITKDLEPSTDMIRICYTGNFAGYVKNLKITERTELTASKDTVKFGENHRVGDNATDGSFTIDWYNLNPLSVTSDNAKFEVVTDEVTSKKDSFATNVTISLKYHHDAEGLDDKGTITVTDAANEKTVTVVVVGKTYKREQAINWLPEYEGESPVLIGGDTVKLATATSGLKVTYVSSDPDIAEVINDTLVYAKNVGPVTITAKQSGNDSWSAAVDSVKEFRVTQKIRQIIAWEQNLTRLNPEAEVKRDTLRARVMVQNQETGELEEVPAQTEKITYAITGASGIVTLINDSIITYTTTEGSTSIRASVPEDETYAAASLTKPVRVRKPARGCDDPLLPTNLQTPYEIFTGTLDETHVDITLDRSQGEPEAMIFYHRGEYWWLLNRWSFYEGELQVQQYVNNQWSDVLYSDTPIVGESNESARILLDRRATKIRITRPKNGQGYHYIDSIAVFRKKYIESATTAINLDSINRGDIQNIDVTVNYSNCKSDLVLTHKDAQLSLKQGSSVINSVSIECGEVNHFTMRVSIIPETPGEFKDTIVIADTIGGSQLVIPVSAVIKKSSQNIIWNQDPTAWTTDDLVLTATATSNDEVTYSVVGESDVAAVIETTGEVTIYKDGEVTFRATQGGNDYYDAVSADKTFTISKVKPTINEVPTAATMILPNTTLSGCVLSGGAASVDGSFAWDDETIDVTLNNTGYKVNFTPDNTNWYDTASCMVVVPVEKQAQVITWNFVDTVMYCNAKYQFDATSNLGLKVSYRSSDNSIAYVDDNDSLRIIKGGDVTITAYQNGTDIVDAAADVAKNLHIHRFTPTIVALPTAATMKIGRLLDNATLSGGRAELAGVEVEGTFSWVDGDVTTMDVAGVFTKAIVFTPANINYYEPVDTVLNVTVEKYAPKLSDIALSGSMINYGQALSNSTLSGTLTATDTVKVPNVPVAGSFAWKDETTIPNAGNPSHAKAVFVPTDTDWYTEVEIKNVPLVVNSVQAANYTANAMIVYGERLSETNGRFTNTTTGLFGELVSGTIIWAEAVDQTQVPAEGEHQIAIRFHSNNPNYVDGDGICTLTVTPGKVFNGGTNGDDNTWGDLDNWLGGDKPGTDDRVTIDADVEITGDVTIGGLTINDGYTVTVAEGATLTVGDDDSFLRDGYGNLYVENGGQVILGTGEVKVKNFTIEAQLGSTNENITSPSSSGQVKGSQKLDVQGDAYFQLAVDPSGRNTYGWYDFVVPFEVDVIGGISIAEAPTTPMQFNVNYAVMAYDESKRAVNGKDWTKFSGTMEPGRVYTITLDETQDWNTVVFKKKQGAPVTGDRSFTTSCSDLGEDVDRGWNGFGNGSLRHMELDVPEGTLVQVYDHTNRCYRPREAKDMSIAVGLSFFMQVDGVQTIELSPAVGNTQFLAPKRVKESTDKFRLALTAEGAANASDYLWVSASEEATGDYVIGRDVLKMGTMSSSKVARMWSSRNGINLCSNEMQMVNDKAECKINLYAPNAGSYTLGVENEPSDAALYLTYNGKAIWSLSASPYQLDLEAGTTEGYGLRVVAVKQTPAITTGMDAAETENIRGRKVIIDNVLYIITPEGAMYDLLGKSVKF